LPKIFRVCNPQNAVEMNPKKIPLHYPRLFPYNASIPMAARIPATPAPENTESPAAALAVCLTIPGTVADTLPGLTVLMGGIALGRMVVFSFGAAGAMGFMGTMGAAVPGVMFVVANLAAAANWVIDWVVALWGV